MENMFQMLGQNMFPKVQPHQSEMNRQKYDQLIALMEAQQNYVGEHNLKMKQKEEELNNLELESRKYQSQLVQSDKERKKHNQIQYNQYQPSFNVQQQQQTRIPSALPKQDRSIQMTPPTRQSQTPTPNTNPNLENPKLEAIYRQIDEQNEYIKQLSEAINNNKPKVNENEDSLEQLVRQKSQSSQNNELLDEIRQLRLRVQEAERPKYYQPPQPFQQYPYMMPPPQMQQQQQTPFQMYPPYQIPQQQQQQQFFNQVPQQSLPNQEDDQLTNALMLQLLAEQGKSKKKHRRRTPPESDDD